jgi:dTDP-4-amino-4,6-dideoxygalactose transaminase
MNVPFLDLKAQYLSIQNEISAAIHEVLTSCAFAGGPFVEQFEKEFASFCQCKSAIGVGSGTEALWLALLAHGIGPGDEVITVPNTFIATAEAISFTGARPVFVDIEDQAYNMDPSLIKAAITPRTKAIIPVHLYGQMADMDPIMDIAKANKLVVIEDACQAHGAQYKRRTAGSIGNAGCFSFYPGKNLGAYGEAGAVVTNDMELDQKIRMLRDHGQTRKYYHKVVGWNGRMHGLQGAILSVKLKYLKSWTEARRRNAVKYNELLAKVEGISIPIEADYAKHVYHLYVACLRNRDALMTTLAEKGIQCGIHYPVPLHLQEAYQSLGKKEGSFPVAEDFANQLVSLPMFPELTEEQIEYVVCNITDFLNQQTK